MALVTFLSDFGTEDHYAAAVKASILGEDPSIAIVDISHHINPSDLAHAAYVLDNVFRDFPEGTVHLCAIDLSGKTPSRLIALKLENHYFTGYDSGLFSLISKVKPAEVVELTFRKAGTFAARDVLGPAAVHILKKGSLKELGPPISELQIRYPRHLKVTKKEIAGNIIRVDHYGNLVTNITKSEFETIHQMNGKNGFLVCFGRERTPYIHADYSEVESGEYFILFNSNGLLQIGINKGNASELFGLHLDAPVQINFEK